MKQRELDATSSAIPVAWRWRWSVAPPWFLSLLFHLGLVILLGLTLQVAPRSNAPGEQTATVGIALKQHDGQHEYFTSEANTDSSSTRVETSKHLSRENLLADQMPSDPSNVLPSASDVLGPGALSGEGVGDAGQAIGGPPRSTQLGKGAARLSVFGAQGEGHKFVYVFDRSGSMGGGRGALDAAKAELIASLKDLDVNHQFQIIFYNEEPWRFNPSGQPGKLAFGTPQNKELARRFVGGITADGATRHEKALLMAISMQPDVIFFLTDADEPRLSAPEMETLVRRAAGVVINAIEFGFGPQQDANNFLVQLARRTGGQHVYVDISRMQYAR